MGGDSPSQLRSSPCSEELTIRLGSAGIFRQLLFLYCSITFMGLEMNHLLLVLQAYPSLDIWCRPPEGYNNMSVEEWKNLSIPVTEDGSYSHCTMYNTTENGSRDEVGCKEWDFDTSHTIVSEWSLVCDRAWLRVASFSIYILGTILGTVVAATMSDRVGRRPVICYCAVFLEVSSMAVYLATNIYVFIIIRFFVGSTTLAICIIAYVLLMEVVSTEERGVYGVNVQYGFSVGVMTASLVGDFKLGWRTYQLINMLPATTLLMAVPFVPESPRWLLSSMDMVTPTQVIRHAGRSDSANAPEICQPAEKEGGPPKSLADSVKEEGHSAIASMLPIDALDVLASDSLRSVNVALCCTWATCGLIVNSLPSTLEITTTLRLLHTVVTGFLPVFAAGIAIDWLGRKLTVAYFLFFAGVLCVVTAIAAFGSPLGFRAPIVRLTDMLVLFFARAAYVTLVVYTTELYPTTVRCFGFCITIVFGRLGILVLPILRHFVASTSSSTHAEEQASQEEEPKGEQCQPRIRSPSPLYTHHRLNLRGQLRRPRRLLQCVCVCVFLCM
ncbi:solute carrier family 22 member 7-like isoform X2 [Ornithodoros turicata]|uniref:solute carrier family 22 member 7-like isoform X2 n=1 Tax=Ornithodoros turicata TaxID=34597 RepID=UPI003138CA3F